MAQKHTAIKVQCSRHVISKNFTKRSREGHTSYVKFRLEKCEALVKGAAELNLISDIKRDIPKFDTVFTQTGATYGENTQAKFQQS